MKNSLLIIFIIQNILVFSQKETTFCDCVKMDQSNLTQECSELKEKWMAQYQEASEDEKAKMEEDYAACTDEPEAIFLNTKSINDFTKKEICFCGKIMAESLQADNNGTTKEYEEKNKVLIDSAKAIISNLNESEFELFVEKMQKCKELNKYFQDPEHPYYAMKNNLTSKNSKKINMEVCDCVDAMQEMEKKMKDADGDEAKLTKIQEEYKDQLDACEKLGEGKSEEEIKQLTEDAINCGENRNLKPVKLSKKLKEQVCNCVSSKNEMDLKIETANGDDEKIKAIQSQYEEMRKFCVKLGEGKSEAEIKAMTEEAKKCKD